MSRFDEPISSEPAETTCRLCETVSAADAADPAWADASPAAASTVPDTVVSWPAAACGVVAQPDSAIARSRRRVSSVPRAP
jgi:hypothetical protein